MTRAADSVGVVKQGISLVCKVKMSQYKGWSWRKVSKVANLKSVQFGQMSLKMEPTRVVENSLESRLVKNSGFSWYACEFINNNSD